MSRPVAWRYLLGGQRKHAFYGAPSTTSRESARCGVGPQWFDPNTWLGARGDEVRVLDELEPCKRCVDNLGRDQ
jgi:hypothetical protein